MSLERTVLLVSPTPTLAHAAAPSLRRTGYRLQVATTYQSAKLQLATSPHVLVTELKLGEYNGLQLALRSRLAGVRTIVIADKEFEAEIEQLGATWVSPEDAASGGLPAAISRLLAMPAATASSDWCDAPREAVETSPPLPARYAHVIH